MTAATTRSPKILVLGDSGVGKSTLIKSYFNERFTNSCQATIGVDFCTKHVNINDRIVPVQIWDTAGEERFQKVTTCMFRNTDCCMLVYDVTERNSFKKVNMWHKEFLRHISPMDTTRFPFVVIGNKTDLDKQNVSTEHVRQWCQLNNNIPYFEIAARDSRRVEDAFKLAAKLAVKYFDEQGSDVTDVCIVLDEDCRSPKNWGYSS